MPGSQLRVIVGFASAIVILAGIRATSTLLIPLVTAAFLALITFPVVQWLRRRGVRSLLAVAGTMLIVLAALVVPGLLMAAAVRQFVEAVPGVRPETAGNGGWRHGMAEAQGLESQQFAALFDPTLVLGFSVGALSVITTLLSVSHRADRDAHAP